MADRFAPPPVAIGTASSLVVPIDMHRVEATMRFDPRSKSAEVEATVEFRLDGPDGRPAFDLRQEILGAKLDGIALPSEALAHRDLGAGHDARMRVVDVELDEGTWHRLELVYRLGTPDSAGSRPLAWEPEGVHWDTWMSDLEAGRYLEMWLPANLCHDRFTLEVDVEVLGGAPHVLLSNASTGTRTVKEGSSWHLAFPERYTALSPLLVLAPAGEVVQHVVGLEGAHAPQVVRCAAIGDVDVDVVQGAADAASWVAYLSQRYGPWTHGDEMLAVIWDEPRGMEYDGATTSCTEALEHEVFHSWFGRGVKPARAVDGWIDEAITTWATSTRRSGPGSGRFAADELGLDSVPVVLEPAHPWARHTPREAYVEGARLLAGVAHMLGGPAPMRAALASLYQSKAGGMITGDGLKAHLSRWGGLDLAPWWERYVHGVATEGPGPR